MSETYAVTTTGILRAIRRHWLLSVGVLGAGMAVATLVVLRLPPTFRVRAAIAVRNPLPHEDMRDLVPRMDERVQGVRMKLLAAPLLLSVARDTGLYRDVRGAGPDEVAALFRRNLTVTAEGGRAFLVSLQGRDPKAVTAALNLLVTRFVEADREEQAREAAATLGYLDGRLLDVTDRLARVDEKLLRFKEENRGSLPEDVEPSLAVLAQSHERLVLGATTELRELRDGNRNLEVLEAEALGRLADLESRYRGEHPDLQRARRTVEYFRALRQTGGRWVTRTTEPWVARGMEKKIQEIEARLANVPVVAEKLGQLVEEQRSLRAQRDELRRQVAAARTAADLAARPESATFRVVEEARVPIIAERPNRPFLLGMSLLACAALAIVAAVLAEAARRTPPAADHAAADLLPVDVASIQGLRFGRGRERPAQGSQDDPAPDGGRETVAPGEPGGKEP